ncbi:MAG TPA: cytochrome P450 [Ktedonobacterales bacterium]|nr:cytochrome P450 [Ktedonobacterales bacterium]
MSLPRVGSRIPTPDITIARYVLRMWRREGHILSALEAMHDALGDIFALPLPGFKSVVMVGPEANRFLLTDERDKVRWRAEGDPVTRLLRQGMLVTDGALHDDLREVITPALHRSLFEGFAQTMGQSVDRVSGQWHEGSVIDLLGEMRRIALLTLMESLFAEDIGPHIETLWSDILRTIRYISPGPWLLWPDMPRLGYRRARKRLDAYLYRLIALRRAQPADGNDLLGKLIAAQMNDELIRDQMLTMFIAGHDTSTALLAWSLYLLTIHPDVLKRVQAEIDTVIGSQMPEYGHVRQLRYLDCVIKETLRLYPPIHLGSRIAADDLTFGEFSIPAGTRVLYSIYLTHRDKKHWPQPEVFDPDRFLPAQGSARPPYTYLPFGGGPRNCIGAAFAQAEAKIVLARLLQRYQFRLVSGKVRPRMRATLEPSRGTRAEVHRRHGDTFV